MIKTIKIVIVDDEKDMRQSISQWLALYGFETETFAGAGDALKSLYYNYPGIIITDIKMPKMDGIQFLKKIKSMDSSLPVIMITGHGDIPMAVDAMRLGAFDFLEKPFNPDSMTALVKRAAASRRLILENRQLRLELSSGNTIVEKLVGASAVMERLREDILDLGQADGHILIEGETGTGKSLVAHALHAVSARAKREFLIFSCAGEKESTVLRRLFGPAGEEDEIPLMEATRGGTLVLEDVELLSLQVQSRLVKAINMQGDPSETRIIAISNLQEQEKICQDVLRPDLYYRLATLRIELSPLRTRGEDILTLFTQYAERFSEEYGCESPVVSAQEAAQLLQAPWPGNVRQLISIAERTVLQSRRGGGTIASLLMAESDADRPAIIIEGKPLKEYVEAFERMLLDNAMRRNRGSIANVMEELCLPRRTLNEKMAKYSLSRANYLS
jgi:DNA-binding NtrC family response regulator